MRTIVYHDCRIFPPQVMFVVRHFVKLDQITNGYQEHVYGEYYGYIQKYGGFIYSLDQKQLFDSQGKTSKTYINSFHFIIFLIWYIIKSKRKIVLVMIYPSVIRIAYELPIFFILKAFGNINIIISVHDLFLEQKEAFTGKMNYFIRLLVRIIDYVFLNMLSDVVRVVSPSYGSYISKIYRINMEKIKVLSNSSFPDLIEPSKIPKTFSVLYAGSLMIGKGVMELIMVISKLRKEGLDIRLILIGESLMSLPNKSWIDISCVPFINMSEYYDRASVCVISFPNKLHYDYARPIKLFDYMAGGKPIISLNLKEISTIINHYNCGITVYDYDGMAEAIKHLYQNRYLISKLGNNGRKAVELEFNWTKRVKELKVVIDSFYK